MPERRQPPVEAVDVLAQRIRNRQVLSQPPQRVLGQIGQQRTAIEQQRVADQARGPRGDLRGPLAPAVQHGGDLFYRLIDDGPAEHFPRDRATTDVAQKVQLGEPEQVGQSDGIRPRRRARPPWIRCQENVSAASQNIRPGRRVPGPETRPVGEATLQKHRDRVCGRAAMKPIIHHLKTFHRPDQRKHQAMKRWPLRLPRILPALGPTAHIPAEGLKRRPFAN